MRLDQRMDVVEAAYQNWGDRRDQHLAEDWFPPLPQRALAHIRPVAFGYAARVWDNIFAAVQHPFDPRKATGWMAKLFQSRQRQQKRASASGNGLGATLIEDFGWRPDDVVLLLHAPQHGYQVTLATLLERFLGYFDAGILCHPRDLHVVVFWDGTGPFYARRRNRTLRQF